MLKKTITWVDFDGNTRTEDFYFNLTKAELTNMMTSVSGGLDKYLTRIFSAQDMPEVAKVVRELIRAAYGVKSDDGRRFMKSEEIYKSFEETEAYSEFFMKLFETEDTLLDFFIGVLPQDMQGAIREEMLKMKPQLAQLNPTQAATAT